MPQQSVLILGFGYTAKFLAPALEALDYKVVSTSRNAGRDLILDLENPKTWKLPQNFDFCVWLAPCPQISFIKDFVLKHSKEIGKIICISSTGFFQTDPSKEECVDENSRIDFSIPRAESEEYLRTQAQAMLVHAAGIYGPTRDPKNWIRRGLVKPSSKLLNLIHVYDLCRFILLCMQDFQPSTRWVLSDDHPKTWLELFKSWKDELEIKDIVEQPAEASKRVLPRSSFKRFDFAPHFRDVFDGLKNGSLEDSAQRTILHRPESGKAPNKT